MNIQANLQIIYTKLKLNDGVNSIKIIIYFII